jgi:hypothetical protein
MISDEYYEPWQLRIVIEPGTTPEKPEKTVGIPLEFPPPMVIFN